ncbi:hypothetical protein FS837_012679 [Tulasnella sp. UAMH 9824]|nr:hypothetical protein FS837_012679 [Tulasnella sp. UAMH 9824]
MQSVFATTFAASSAGVPDVGDDELKAEVEMLIEEQKKEEEEEKERLRSEEKRKAEEKERAWMKAEGARGDVEAGRGRGSTENAASMALGYVGATAKRKEPVA